MRSLFALLLLALFQDDQARQALDLIEKLRSDLLEEREAAAGKLRDLGELALEPLRRFADDSDAEVRARVRSVLRRLEWEPVLSPALLRRHISLNEALERGDARAILHFPVDTPPLRSEQRPDSTHFDAFAIQCLRHSEVEVRKSAILLLRVTTEYIHQQAPRRPVREVLSEIAKWAPEAYDDADRLWLCATGDVAIKIASSADRSLCSTVRAQHPDAERLLDLIRAAVGIEEAQAAILSTLESGPYWLQTLALRIVEKIGYGPARKPILKRLRDPEWYPWAARAMTVIADASCGKELVAFYRDTPPAERSWLQITPLVRSGAAEAVPLLTELLQSKDRYQRDAAGDGLAELGARESLDALLEAMGSEEEISMREGAAVAAAKLLDGKTVGRFLGLLDSPKKGKRNAARSYMRYIRDSDAQRKVVEVFEKESNPERRRDLFGAILSDDFLRAGGAGVEEMLEKVVRLPADPLVPEATVHLLRMKGKDAAKALEDLAMSGAPGTAGFLGALSDYPTDRLVPRVVELIKSKKALEPGMTYLGKLATPLALAELEKLAGEGSPEMIRHAARFALDRPTAEDLETSFDAEGRKQTFYSSSLPFQYKTYVEKDTPGFRDWIREQVRQSGPTHYVHSLKHWAHSEMIDGLKKCLASYDAWSRNPERLLGFNDGPRAGHILSALAATGDRNLVPLFLERLGDDDHEAQSVAASTLGQWRVQKAVPALKRLVRSERWMVRQDALLALAKIGEPGTIDFIKEQLRDNPHAAPYALARLEASQTLPDILRLLPDGRSLGVILGAAELLANPEVYKNIDATKVTQRYGRLRDYLPLLEKALGRPIGLSPAVKSAQRTREDSALFWYGSSVRDFLEQMGSGHFSGGNLTPLCRDGTVEICTVDEALAYWRQKARELPGK